MGDNQQRKPVIDTSRFTVEQSLDDYLNNAEAVDAEEPFSTEEDLSAYLRKQNLLQREREDGSIELYTADVFQQDSINSLQAKQVVDDIARGKSPQELGFLPAHKPYDFQELIKANEAARRAKIAVQSFEPPEVRIGRDFLSGFLSTAEGIVGTVQWLGIDKAKDWGDKLKAWNEEIKVEDPNLADQVVAGLGSQAMFFIPGFGSMKLARAVELFSPRIARLFGLSVATFLESGTEAGSVYREELDKAKLPELPEGGIPAIDDSEASSAATKTFFTNLLLNQVTNKFGPLGESAEKAIKTALRSMTAEGLQELGQQFISNSATGRPLTEGAFESWFVGSVIGAAGGAGLHGRPKETQEEKAPSPPIEVKPGDQFPFITNLGKEVIATIVPQSTETEALRQSAITKEGVVGEEEALYKDPVIVNIEGNLTVLEREDLLKPIAQQAEDKLSVLFDELLNLPPAKLSFIEDITGEVTQEAQTIIDDISNLYQIIGHQPNISEDAESDVGFASRGVEHAIFLTGLKSLEQKGLIAAPVKELAKRLLANAPKEYLRTAFVTHKENYEFYGRFREREIGEKMERVIDFAIMPGKIEKSKIVDEKWISNLTEKQKRFVSNQLTGFTLFHEIAHGFYQSLKPEVVNDFLRWRQSLTKKQFEPLKGNPHWNRSEENFVDLFAASAISSNKSLTDLIISAEYAQRIAGMVELAKTAPASVKNALSDIIGAQESGFRPRYPERYPYREDFRGFYAEELESKVYRGETGHPEYQGGNYNFGEARYYTESEDFAAFFASGAPRTAFGKSIIPIQPTIIEAELEGGKVLDYEKIPPKDFIDEVLKDFVESENYTKEDALKELKSKTLRQLSTSNTLTDEIAFFAYGEEEIGNIAKKLGYDAISYDVISPDEKERIKNYAIFNPNILKGAIRKDIAIESAIGPIDKMKGLLDYIKLKKGGQLVKTEPSPDISAISTWLGFPERAFQDTPVGGLVTDFISTTLDTYGRANEIFLDFDKAWNLNDEQRINVTKALREYEKTHSEDPLKTLTKEERIAADKWIEYADKVRKRVIARREEEVRENVKKLGQAHPQAFDRILKGEDPNEVFKDFPRLGDPGKRAIIMAIDDMHTAENWGLEDYVTHAEMGHLRLIRNVPLEDGSTEKRVFAIAENVSVLVAKAEEYLASHPGETVEFDDEFDVDTGFSVPLSVKQYGMMMGRLAKAFGESSSKVQAALRNNPNLKFGLKPTKKYSRFFEHREDMLKGEDNLWNVIPSYIFSIERKLALDPLLKEARRARSVLEGTTLTEFDDFVAGVKGKKYAADKVVDQFLHQNLGLISRPFALSRALRIPLALQTITKLGLRPVADLLNYTSGIHHVLTKTSLKAFKDGKAFAKTTKGEEFWEQDKYKTGYQAHIATEFFIDKGLQSVIEYATIGRSAGERVVRKDNYFAGYVWAKENLGMDDEAARQYAIRLTRFSQAVYNIEALPKIARGAIGKTILKFKPWMINEIQFMASLKGNEWFKYIAGFLAIGGPRAAILTAKSIPIFALLGLGGYLDEIEEWLNKNFSREARGLPGILGYVFNNKGWDISAPASWQLPQSTTEWFGPLMSDISKIWSAIVKPFSVGAPFDAKRLKTAIKNLSPVTIYLDDMIEALETGEIQDDKGRPLYIPKESEKYGLALGVQPTEATIRKFEKKMIADLENNERQKVSYIVNSYLDAERDEDWEKVNRYAQYIEEEGISWKTVTAERERRNEPLGERLYKGLPKRLRDEELLYEFP